MMSKRMLCVVGILILIGMIGLPGCERSEEKKGIETAVRRYNDALMTAFENMDFGPLKDVTTEQEHRKVTTYVKSYAAQGDRLHARLVDLSVLNVDRRGSAAKVRTSETWEYQRVRAETGSPETGKTTYEYEMEYNIIFDNKRWKVDSLKIQKEGHSPIKGQIL